MRRAPLFVSVLKYVPLVYVVAAMFYDQILWGDDDFLRGIYNALLWIVLIAGWLFRQGQHVWVQKKVVFKPSGAVLPLCLLFAFV